VRFPHFFIERPIFAAVISILITLVGAIAYFALPVAQYPEIAPPSIQVSTSYPGASAEVVSDTVATPLEQEINGVEGMLYQRSESTGDGRLAITVTFRPGTNLDVAQVLVQNRVAIAEPRLPEEVRRRGVTVIKNSPDLLMVIHMRSPDATRSLAYISNYTRTQIIDRIARLNGVGEARIFSERAYSMRIWLDPDKVASFGLTGTEVVEAIRANNVQVASGTLNRQPVPQQRAFEIGVESQGRFIDPEQFSNIVVSRGATGQVVKLRDLARVELGAEDYSTLGYLDGTPALPILVFQRPGSNALATAAGILKTMADLEPQFPTGLGYSVVYNPTRFIEESVNKVYTTIFEAVLLVVLVVVVFLQDWRAAVIPVVAIPISLIGTFAVMSAFDFSLNNLTLFGLVLAIGIVVDDAIVVVENMERFLREGMNPREAAHKTMEEVGGALVAIALVLSAVFIPTAFVSGIAGQFYRQFALTIATATIISAVVSLTLSPALGAILMRGHDHAPSHGVVHVLMTPFRLFARGFNASFDALARGYGYLTSRLVRLALVVLVIYAGLLALTIDRFSKTPTGFIPEQDQGYLIGVFQLPPGASVARTDAVIRKASGILLGVPGVAHTVGFAGFDGATFTNASNGGAIFIPLAPFPERAAQGLSARAVLEKAQQALGAIPEAIAFVIQPPPVRGIGTGGGWKLYVQDLRGRGVGALEQVTRAFIQEANQQPQLSRVFSLFNTATPKLYADIDRVRAEKLKVPVERVLDTLEVYLGSAYVNDFNFLGRTYRVTAQADGEYRLGQEDLLRLKTRSDSGAMVPLGSLMTVRDITGPQRVPRYNLYKAAEVLGSAAPGVSSSTALDLAESVAARTLPDGFSFEWTELALQQRLASDSGLTTFAMAVVFVFLLLAALYESWTLPLAVVLIVPMCLLAAVVGVGLRGIENNLLVQVGFVVLIGLAAKNAILIVEFARQSEEQGSDRFTAAAHAARMRLRPILMTSFAFIMGVLPLVFSEGAGAEMRRALGTAVFSGMLGVTFFGLLFTPVFYVVCRRLAMLGQSGRPAAARKSPLPSPGNEPGAAAEGEIGPDPVPDDGNPVAHTDQEEDMDQTPQPPGGST
jgi:hydrophobe/amphiphile efflux-1 (HAE1) family protein